MKRPPLAHSPRALALLCALALSACATEPAPPGPSASACTGASSCEGADTECAVRTCTQGTCGRCFLLPGTRVATQVAGDCRVRQCDGAGQAVSVPDVSDTFDDSNACTIDACSSRGAPAHTPNAEGSACGAGGAVCDGAGGCAVPATECTQASTCPGTDEACRVRTCSRGACGFQNVALGTPVADPDAGDCRRQQCNGAGSVEEVDDDSDRPPSTDCSERVCRAGTPTALHQPAGTACDEDGGTQCDGAGRCVDPTLWCTEVSECPPSTAECAEARCTQGVCGFEAAPHGAPVSSQTRGDCRREVCDGAFGTTTVNDDTDAPASPTQCADKVCRDGTPVSMARAEGSACNENGGTRCDGAGSCVP